ncbi:MAG: 30S ribosomal protein S17 [Candidatus Pacebacteria bacterium]|nr:30S ribosomal protein S17 [Candidatus Paceibacterota bacterium]
MEKPSITQHGNSKIERRKRVLEGEVISNKMQKTVVVRVSSVRLHPKYKKYYRVSRNFKVHDEKNQCQIGDKVIIEETRPLSKDKRWRVISLASHGQDNKLIPQPAEPVDKTSWRKD